MKGMIDKGRYLFRRHRAKALSIKEGRILARRFAIGAALLSLFVYWLHPVIFERIDVRIRDVVFQIRQAPPPPSEVAVVAVDEKSVKKFGRWPWTRSIQGQLFRQLKKMGATVIALDIVYPFLQNPTEDQALISALDFSGTPIVGGYFFREKQSLKTNVAAMKSVQKNRISLVMEKPGALLDTVADYPFVESNHLSFSSHFSRLGFFNSMPDTDGLIRFAPLVLKYHHDYYPSLPLQALAIRLQQQVFIELDQEGVSAINLGNLALPINKLGKLALNFYNGPHRIPLYSASDVIDGVLPDSAIQGKLIFVGVTELGIADVRPTPIEHSFPGVAIHATVAANILQGFHLYHDNRIVLLDIVLMALVPLLMLWAMSRLTRPLFMTLIFLVTASVVWTIFYQVVTKYGLLISLFYPMVSVILSFTIFETYEIFITESKTKFLRRAFSSYISPSLVGRLIKEPDSLVLKGENRIISVLFSDIRSFTTLSEGMAPEQLVLLLNHYLGPMTEIIMRQNGTLDKYIGDAVMAIYNAPMDVPDHAKRAAQSAIVMQQTLNKLNTEFEKEFDRNLRIGIGIHTGEAVVGNMGSTRRFNYTAMGDTVNLASRLEGRTKFYHVEILISKETQERLEKGFLTRRLDKIRVKGKNKPVEIYQLFLDVKDERIKAMVKIFESALELYFAGEFAAALAQFEQNQKSYPDDYPTKIYIERCRSNLKNPPEGVWDGVFTMTEK